MDRRFLIKLFAIEAVILIVLVLASIQFKDGRQPEEYVGRDFRLKQRQLLPQALRAQVLNP